MGTSIGKFNVIKITVIFERKSFYIPLKISVKGKAKTVFGWISTGTNKS